MKTAIRHGLGGASRAQAAALYWSAFGGKLGRVMGPEPKALAFIERVIDPSHLFTATDGEGRLLGVIGFRTSRGSFVGGTRADLVAVYGRFGAAWRTLALAVLATELAEREMCIDGLAVAAPVRGLGLGAALVEELARHAQARGYSALRLDVVGENLRARALYQRLGFAATGRMDRWLTAAMFGYRSSLAMRRKL